MDALQLLNSLKDECGIVTPDFTAVTGLTGEGARLWGWIKQAWVSIQIMKDDWEFLRATKTFTTTALKQEYTLSDLSLTTTFGQWKSDSFRLYLTSAGVKNEILLEQWEYNSYRNYYLLGARKETYGRPVVISVTPTRSLSLGLPPNDDYTVTGEYFTAPVTLAAKTDTPTMPAKFHMMIVYKGMMYYGGYESAPEVYQRGKELFGEFLDSLMVDQCPTVIGAGSLI